MCALLKTRKTMRWTVPSTMCPLVLVATLVLAMAPVGCATAPRDGFGHWWLSDKECLTRAMYFESNRSSDAGMLAVGTVVMNRLESGEYPHSICGVVGQPGQFASGVLDQPISGPGRARAERIADVILAGARHPGVGRAMYFHTAGVSSPNSNKRYVVVAGGNAFYEKTAGSYVSGSMPTAFGAEAQFGDAARLAFFLQTGRGL